MSDGQSVSAEPITMEDALAMTDSALSAKEVEPEQPAQELEPEVEAEGAEAETVETLEEDTDADEPETVEDEGSDQILTADEYGDVLVDVKGTPTPLSDLINGNLRQADYTRKTQETAEKAKAVTAELEKRTAELDAREQQLAEQLSQIEEQEPDWEQMAEDDPLGWPLEKARWDKKAKQRAEQNAARDARQSKAREAFRGQTAAKAVEVFPEWGEAGKFDEGVSARTAVAKELGFTEEEISASIDFRIAAALEMAARYKALASEGKAKVDLAEKKIRKAPKVLKPGQAKGETDPKAERRAAIQKRLSKPIDSAAFMREMGIR